MDNAKKEIKIMETQDSLLQKIKELEEDNKKLRERYNQCVHDIFEYDDKVKDLEKDMIRLWKTENR